MTAARAVVVVATLAGVVGCGPPDLGGGAINVGECTTPRKPSRTGDTYAIRLRDPGPLMAPAHPVPGAVPGMVTDDVRIVEAGHERKMLDYITAAQIDEELACDTRDGELAVFCLPGASALAPGAYQVLAYRLAAPFPLETDRHYQYGVSLDRNGDGADNYRPGDTPTFLGSRDFFYDTDLWITLDHVPGTGWRARVRDATSGTIRDRASNLRVIVDGDRVSVLVPDRELEGAPGGAPGYRLSVHCHSGDYGVSTPWAGVTLPATPALTPMATTACADQLDVLAAHTDVAAGEAVAIAAQARCSGNGATFDATDAVTWEAAPPTFVTAPGSERGSLTAVVPLDAAPGSTATLRARHPAIVPYDEITLALDRAHASLAVRPADTALAVGIPVNVRAEATLDDGRAADLAGATWITSDAAVATIGAEPARPHVITPLRRGRFEAIAMAGANQGRGAFEVSDAAPRMIEIEPQMVMVPAGVAPPVTTMLTLDDGTRIEVQDSPSYAQRVYWQALHQSGPVCVDTELAPPDGEPIPYRDDIDVVVDRMPSVTLRPAPALTLEEDRCTSLTLEAETGGRTFDVTALAAWSDPEPSYLTVGTAGAARGIVCGRTARSSPVVVTATYGATTRMVEVTVVPRP